MLKTLRLLFLSFLCIIICNSFLFAEVKICSEVDFFAKPIEERISTWIYPSICQLGFPIRMDP